MRQARTTYAGGRSFLPSSDISRSRAEQPSPTRLASLIRACTRRALASFVLVSGVSSAMRAQNATSSGRSDPALCFGFAFGSWTPPLDWQAAGHGPPLDSARVPRAPNGRGWAAIDVEATSDSTLLLFPPWWPAGIAVRLATKPTSPRDTVPGRAVAFVADGQKRPPTSSVRLWRVPCGQ